MSALPRFPFPLRAPAAAVLAAAALLLVGGCEVGAPARVEAPADTAAGEVPIRLAGSNDAALLVPVHLNGHGPLDFVLDTGATFTCVAGETAAELGLPPRRGAVGVGVGIGGAGRVDFVHIDSLRIGRAQAFDMPACVLDLQQFGALGTPIQGLVGLNFLRSFRLTLDFERGVLRLVEP